MGLCLQICGFRVYTFEKCVQNFTSKIAFREGTQELLVNHPSELRAHLYTVEKTLHFILVCVILRKFIQRFGDICRDVHEFECAFSPCHDPK